MNTDITIHLFGESIVRNVIKDGNPWFLAKDVCEALGLGNVSHAVNGNEKSGNLGLDDDEKGIMNHDTPGGSQEMLFVNESGLYALIFKSRKPEARAFRKWVTSEVLPSIRKRGYYGRRSEQILSFAKELIEMGFESKDASILTRSAFPSITRREERLEEAEQQNREAAEDPEASLFLSLMGQSIEYRVNDFYQMLPAGHRILAIKTPKGRSTAIGMVMERLVRNGKLRRINARHATFALASEKIVPMER